MILKVKLAFLFILVTSFTSCFKDSEDISEEIIKPKPKIIIESANLVVKVTNENGTSLTGISADFNNEIKVVDNSSIFYFSTKKISKADEVLTITDKEGEIFQYKIYSIENEVNYHDICIFKNYTTDHISSQDVKTLHLNSGQSITLSADNYKQGQKDYNGNITLKYHSFDLSNELHRKALPGGNTILKDGVRKAISFKEVIRFDVYDSENRVINFKDAIQIKMLNNVDDHQVILYYNRIQQDWEITNITADRNNIPVLKSGIYAIAEINEAVTVKGRITFNQKEARNENILLSYDDQNVNVQTTNNGLWETILPINKNISIDVKHECIKSSTKEIFNEKAITDVGTIEYTSNEIAVISVKANIKDCNEQLVDNVLMLIETTNESTHLLVTKGSTSIEQNVCIGGEPKLKIIGNNVVSNLYNIQENNIDLGNFLLCEKANDEYLYIKDEQNNKVLYNQLVSAVDDNDITIEFNKSNDQRLKLEFMHDNKEGIINPIRSNMVWFDSGFGSNGIAFNCPSAIECGFTSLQLTYINSESEYVRGKFSGRFWIKTINPVTASYKNVEAEFQIRR